MTPTSPSSPTGKRRRYSSDFKARVVKACRQQNQSVAAIALNHGLNANLVHKWIRKARLSERDTTIPAFLPLSVPPLSAPVSSPAAESIRIEVTRDSDTLVIEWPLSDTVGCHALLRELLR